MKIQTYCSINSINSKILFDAFFWLPNNRINYPRFYIRIGRVESSSRLDVSKYIEEVEIPKFAEWILMMINFDPQNTLFSNPKNLYFGVQIENYLAQRK